MRKYSHNTKTRSCLMGGLLLATLVVQTAAGQEVNARLSSDSAAVGQPVQFQITATGRSQARMMDELAVDGLEVVSFSDQFQMQMQFPGMGMQVTTIFTFVIVPSREGELSIPPLRLRLDGKVIKTQPTVLSVEDSVPTLRAQPVPPGVSPPIRVLPFDPPPTPQDQGAPSRGTFGEIVIPQETAYVGEVVPVELRFYVDARLPPQFSERPDFGGDGFTVQRMAKPTELQREIDGVPYACIVYRTAITPAKAGKLEIPGASLAARVQVPISSPRGVDDFFGGMLRNFGMTDIREVEIMAEPVTLDVKPLPTEGRPGDFAGAVGSFELEVSASPTSPAAGEPISLNVLVSGRGNFEAMGAPGLVNTEGWRTYDPSENFVPSPTDPIGLHGSKKFEFTLVAMQDRRATPEVRFSYFDPGQERYVTLDGPPVAVNAPGTGQPTPAPTMAEPESRIAEAQPGPSDGLSRDYLPADFRPLAWGTGFIVAGSALAGLWTLGLLGLLVRRALASPAAAQSARRRQLRKSLQALSDPSLSTESFLTAANQFLEARLEGRNLHEFELEESCRSRIEKLNQLHGESLYSTKKPSELDPETRMPLIAALTDLDTKLGKK